LKPQSIPFALALPFAYLWTAGWMIASARRDEWRQEWLGEVWFRWRALNEGGHWHWRSMLHFHACALGCFKDAWSEMLAEEERSAGLRACLREPSICAASLAAGLLLVALASGCFPTTKIILSDLPYKNASRLAMVTRTGRLEGIRRGIPSKLVEAWRAESKLLVDVAGFSIHRAQMAVIGKNALLVFSIEGSENLLDVLGEPVSKDLRLAMAAGERISFVSYEFWMRDLHGDPSVVGRRVWCNKRVSVIGGILPQKFWLVSPSVQIYELSSREIGEQDRLLVLSKLGVTAWQLENNLLEVADRLDMPFTRTAPHVLFFEDALRAPLWLFGASFLIAALLVCIAQSSRLQRDGSRGGCKKAKSMRWWFFLLFKTAAALLLVFTLGLETIVGLNRQPLTAALGGPALLWFYSVGCLIVLYAVVADQQARCRVCLRTLAYPIRIGCPGCLFLDWSGTELLCPDGHGALYVPHHVSCWDQAERWIALEV
jgi:hypothetical protein